MFRKTHIPNLLILLAFLALTACVPQSPSTGTVTLAPATQEPATHVPAGTETSVPHTTNPATQQPATSSPSVGTATCTEPVELTVTEGTVSYKYVQFKVDPGLGFNFTVQECEAGVESGSAYSPVYPAHLIFKANSPLSNNFVQPEIRIYEVSGNPQSYTYPLNSLAELQQVLDERPEPSPWYSGVALHTGEKYLDSHYSIGVRAIVEYLQDPFFWTNNYLQYTYNGLTDDGRYFVSASFPLNALFLMDIQGADPRTNINPQAIAIPEWTDDYEQERKIIDAYNQEALHRFELSAPADFTPDYELYDALVQSLQIGVQSSAPSSAEAVCFTPADILPFATTPDSTSILVRGNRGVQIFNLGTLKEASFIQAPKNIVTAALSPDGETLAWSLEDNTIQLLRMSDQKVLHTLSGHTDMVTKLRFSPDGDLLVSASHDRWVKVWDMQGEELRSFQPPGEVLGIGISPDGSALATVPFDGPVALWDLNTLEKIKDLGGSGGYDTSDAEFSPDGQYVAADLASSLYLWRISDGELVWNEIKNSMAITFSPDGRYLAYSDIDDNNKVFLSTPDGSEIVRVLAGHQGPVWGMFFSPDSQLLVSNDGLEIRIWHVEDGSLRYIGKAACP